MSLSLHLDGLPRFPCTRQAKVVLSRLRIMMTLRKMTLVMFLAMEGVVLWFEFETGVVVQVMLRIGGWDGGDVFIDVSVVGVCEGV